MIKRIRQWIKSLGDRLFLAAQDDPAVWLAEPVGATADWSPVAEVEHAIEHEQEDEARAELAAAAADLKPLLDDFHKRMARAFITFDTGMLAATHTTARWHAAGRDCCQLCAEHRARTFGAIGERFGIRSFRIDTDTAEYKIYNPHTARELAPA